MFLIFRRGATQQRNFKYHRVDSPQAFEASEASRVVQSARTRKEEVSSESDIDMDVVADKDTDNHDDVNDDNDEVCSSQV